MPSTTEVSGPARIVLQCPVSEATSEGVTMDVLEFLRDQAKGILSCFHSCPRPAVFRTTYGTKKGEPLGTDGTVVFTIDCLTIQIARDLINDMWSHLWEINDATSPRLPKLRLVAAIHVVDHHDWLPKAEA
jgi:hypothetical protein